MNNLDLTDVVRLHEFGEAAGWLDLYRAAPPELRMKTFRVGGAVGLICPVDRHVLFNRVLGLDVNEPATGVMLDEIAAIYRAEGIDRYEIGVVPTSKSGELASMLEARGFRREGNTVKCIREARNAAEASTDLRVEESDSHQATDITGILIEVFDMGEGIRSAFEGCVGRPDWHFYLGFDGARPVATGLLHIENGVGWLSSGATLASHRRRGAQAAIMACRINEAIAQGCEWIIVETGEETPDNPNPSYHNMIRLGFEPAYVRTAYLSP